MPRNKRHDQLHSVFFRNGTELLKFLASLLAYTCAPCGRVGQRILTKRIFVYIAWTVKSVKRLENRPERKDPEMGYFCVSQKAKVILDRFCIELTPHVYGAF